MTHTPRSYQQRAVQEALDALNQHHRVLLTLPTGAGKSLVGYWIGQHYKNPLWIAPRREIVDQLRGRAVTIQSLLSGDRPEADLLIYDECHHASVAAPAWFAVADHYSTVLGLSATPARHDGTPLGDLFNHLVVGATYSELMADGYLMEPRVVRPAEELQGLAQDPAKVWRDMAKDRRTFAFFSRVQSAEKFCSKVNDGPLLKRAAVLSGDMPTKDRDAAVAEFRSGHLQVLASCQVLSEGFDAPEADCALVACGCTHAGGWMQRVGRVLRPAEGKRRPLVLDLAGVSHRLGLPHEDRIFSLTGSPIRRRDAEAIQQCKACGCVYPPAPKCPECGCVPEPKPARVRIWNLPMSEVCSVDLTPEQRGKLTWKDKMLRDDEARYTWLARKAKHPGHAAAMHAAMFGGPMPRDWWGRMKRGK